MNIKELRTQFETEYKSSMFYLDRDLVTGEYSKMTTFQAWCGYKVCASLNGILPKDFNIYGDDAK